MNTEIEMYREWYSIVAPRYNKISETPRCFEWRETKRVAEDGTPYTDRALFADIDMQWRKGQRVQRGWQFITAVYE